MSKPETIDTAAANKFFSVHCFNQAWEMIEKCDRTTDDDEQMLLLGYASLWHWTQRPDCARRTKSIGYWQLSRIHALLGHAHEARQYGQLSLEHCVDDEPFFVGYAYEALARAELIANDRDTARQMLEKARRCADAVTDAEERGLLQNDLQSLGSSCQ